MLERAIEITTTVGELGMPLELVSTVQSGALTGLGCLQRLREILIPPDAEHRPMLLRPMVDEPQPSSSARWLVHTASRLLPPGNRDRYAEEFAAELRALADTGAGSRPQLAHAVRQVATIWALRRALPSAAPQPTDDTDCIRESRDAGHHRVTQPRLS